MPHAFRIFNCMRSLGYAENLAIAVGRIAERGRDPDKVYSHDSAVNEIFDCDCDERLAVALAHAMRNCFFSQKQGQFYDRIRLKRSFINAGLCEANAERILVAIDPAVLTPRVPEIREAINYAPGAGRVVMCDFTHLVKPEMLKERRAIVVSPRANNAPGRCTVIPVSKSHPRGDLSQYHEFPAGSYPFFHPRESVWAVCDHVYTVSLKRLWRVNVNRRPQLPQLRTDDFEEIRRLVGTALGVYPLTEEPGHENVLALAGGKAKA